ncbi:MAG: alpha amylase C-terminal domain-containing protein [Collinsella sp.]
MSDTKLKPATKKPATRKAAPHAPELSKDDVYLFGIGMWERSWEKMGAHPDTQNRTRGWRFCVWAPDVKSVHVIGEFNDWDEEANPLVPVHTSAIWEGFIPGAEQGQLYKYLIETNEGEKLYKADPYAFKAECPPGTASVLWTLDGYKWNDAAWLKRRAGHNHMSQPLNIYEVHIGSWKRHGDAPQGEPDEYGNYPGPMDPFPAQRGEFYTYDDLSVELVDYVHDMGYTHIEVMPLMEHPFDGSWGYQTTGYYAATSRYGNPQQLMHFIDACHKAGIGVIMDWVPGGFCADSHGLATFNGHMLFEHEIHPNWGTHKFDFARGESALPGLQRAVLGSRTSMWTAFAWTACPACCTSTLASTIRPKEVQQVRYRGGPGRQRLSARSTAPWRPLPRRDDDGRGVHRVAARDLSPQDGGLGFHYKWDMGWMNDTLHYMQTDFPWRPGNHGLLTFSIMYAFTENFICPLSHDEVVHGKCSLIGRMPGDWWRQFAGLRTLAFYQMTHPGAKLNFMGNEIGQFIEWRYYESIQWFLTEEYETHRHHQAFIKALNHLYTAEPALYERGYTDDGFTWIDADNSKQSIVSFVRQGEDVDEDLVILINFDPASYESFRVGVPREGDWEVIFDSDRPEFGGSGYAGEEPYTCSSEPYPWNGQMDSIEIKVPGLAGVVLKRRGPSSYKPPVVEAPKKATRKRTSSVKPKHAAAKKAPAKAKATTAKAKATATKKPAAKKAATKAKSGSVKSSVKDA